MASVSGEWNGETHSAWGGAASEKAAGKMTAGWALKRSGLAEQVGKQHFK